MASKRARAPCPQEKSHPCEQLTPRSADLGTQAPVIAHMGSQLTRSSWVIRLQSQMTPDAICRGRGSTYSYAEYIILDNHIIKIIHG